LNIKSGRKYRFTGQTKSWRSAKSQKSVELSQIRRISDGAPGGWIESEENLSHGGDCWIGPNVMVSGGATITDYAELEGHVPVTGWAEISGSAKISGHGKPVSIFDHAFISDYAVVTDGTILSDRVRILDASEVHSSTISNNAVISGFAVIKDNCHVFGDSVITGYSRLESHVIVVGNSRVSGRVTLSNNVKVNDSELADFVSLQGVLIDNGYLQSRANSWRYQPISFDMLGHRITIADNHFCAKKENWKMCFQVKQLELSIELFDLEEIDRMGLHHLIHHHLQNRTEK